MAGHQNRWPPRLENFDGLTMGPLSRFQESPAVGVTVAGVSDRLRRNPSTVLRRLE